MWLLRLKGLFRELLPLFVGKSCSSVRSGKNIFPSLVPKEMAPPVLGVSPCYFMKSLSRTQEENEVKSPNMRSLEGILA